VINSEYTELDAFVAPDESYIVFTSNRPGGLGTGDLYVSRQKDGAWTPRRIWAPGSTPRASSAALRFALTASTSTTQPRDSPERYLPGRYRCIEPGSAGPA